MDRGENSRIESPEGKPTAQKEEGESSVSKEGRREGAEEKRKGERRGGEGTPLNQSAVRGVRALATHPG